MEFILIAYYRVYILPGLIFFEGFNLVGLICRPITALQALQYICDSIYNINIIEKLTFRASVYRYVEGCNIIYK